MQRRKNIRGYDEDYIEGQHLKLKDLRKKKPTKYLQKNIPAYPQPEFHVSHLKHDTDRAGLKGICSDGGLKILGKGSLLWWSLAVGPDDIRSAETRLLEKTFPDREQDQEQQSFLWKFATSPAFLETSRMGSYRFTFPLEEVLKAYREQFCSGAEPVMQVFETVLYSQQVMYSVLVHSPANQELFSEDRLLTDNPTAVCVFKDGHFIWRSEAMCETHRYELIPRYDENQMEVRKMSDHEFYVWDHVTVALHLEEGQVLKFDADQLRKNLTFCTPGYPPLRGRTFENFSDAENLVKKLWPDCPGSLEKEMSLQHSFAASPETEPDSSD